MAITVYLLDKSAAVPRLGAAAESRRERLVIQGRLAVTEMTALELLYSARNADAYRAIAASLAAYRWLPVTHEVMRRALEVQALLAERGQHRRPIPDLVIAATAEVHGATVLHNDHDFEVIAEVTGQRVERVTATS